MENEWVSSPVICGKRPAVVSIIDYVRSSSRSVLPFFPDHNECRCTIYGNFSSRFAQLAFSAFCCDRRHHQTCSDQSGYNQYNTPPVFCISQKTPAGGGDREVWQRIDRLSLEVGFFNFSQTKKRHTQEGSQPGMNGRGLTRDFGCARIEVQGWQ